LPIGAVGELYIGGAGLARGYLNRPELTAERFISNPFSNDTGSRLYRTGDLVRYLPDGNLEFIGRVDHQVKVRGFRIELGEIEASLLDVSDVSDVVVVAREGQADSSDKQLVAYIVAEGSYVEDEAAKQDFIGSLRSTLQQRLPDYMIPSAFVVLDSFPLTTNGKLDRQALPAPGDMDVQRSIYVAPRTEIEAKLCTLWQEVLKLERVGVHDNFFELGGHSLTLIQLRHHVKHFWGVDLSLKILYENRTLETQAKEIETCVKTPFMVADNAISLRLNSSLDEKLFCIHPLGGLGFAYEELALELEGKICVYAIQCPDVLSDRNSESIIELVDMYVQEIIQTQGAGPYSVLGWSSGGLYAYEIANRLNKLGHGIAQLIILDGVPFDSSNSIWLEAVKAYLGEGLKVDWDYLAAINASLAKEKLVSAATEQHLLFDTKLVARTIEWISRAGMLAREHDVSRTDLDIRLFLSMGNLKGIPEWTKLTSGQVKAHKINCSHHEIIKKPYVLEVIKFILNSEQRE
ncbi:thioesterase domain-containing protein, partial [Kordiimonas aquimaris]|uniref:thioesterase domain-containing protein n=1 Tax=Kordiimonas aquimaris TaxID=707591 RepID=UPI0021D15DF4